MSCCTILSFTISPQYLDLDTSVTNDEDDSEEEEEEEEERYENNCDSDSRLISLGIEKPTQAVRDSLEAKKDYQLNSNLFYYLDHVGKLNSLLP
eukprot:jgi/Bigna1/136163/aug1.32_g10871